MAKKTDISCLIDLERVRGEITVLAALAAEIDASADNDKAKTMKFLRRTTQRFLKTVEASRQPKRKHLKMFVYLAQKYRNGDLAATAPEVVTVEELAPPAPTGRDPNRNLVRNPDKTQTKIAKIIVENYQPGNVFTLESILDKLRHFVPDGKKPGQWIGTYMSREMNHGNGILEKEGPARYRLRDNAAKILKNRRVST